MSDLRPVGFIIGLVIVFLGAAMLVPMALDFSLGNGNGPAFAEAAIVTPATGCFVLIACRDDGRTAALSVRQAFLLTLSAWVLVPLAGALPFMLGAPGAGFTDGYFESVSALTTTGATVFVDLDRLPVGANLWRGMLTWIGGLGIAFVVMNLLPVMRVGGMQFFRTEGFKTLGKVLPAPTTSRGRSSCSMSG